MKIVRVIDDGLKSEMMLAEIFSGSLNELTFTGELIAESPTVEEYIEADPHFKEIFEAGHLNGCEHLLEGQVIYREEKAGRAYIVPKEFVEIMEVN